MLTSPLLGQTIGDSEIFQQVTRLNFGVVFTPVRSVTLVTDVWSHIFDLHLPNVTRRDQGFRLPYCENATSTEEQTMMKQTCERNRQVILELHRQHVAMEHQISLALRHIYHLLPTERKLPRSFGPKRSLLPIGGDLLHSLFGTTTDDDLRPIKEHISRIAKGISHLGHGLQIQQHEFTSFVQIAADKMEAFSNITVNHEHALGELRDRLRILFDTQAQDQQRLIAAIQHLQKFVNQIRHIDELRHSIESLLHGILTPQLISKITLRSTLLGIKSAVQRRFRKSHLVFEHATDFYAMRNFHFGRHDNHLLILLQVPITSFNEQFQIFKVTRFPIFVTGQTSHTTILQDIPLYYATNRRNTRYFTLDQDNDSENPALLYTINKPIAFHDPDAGASCVSALFHNDVGKIHQLCTFTLSRQPLVPNILFLNNGDILLTVFTSPESIPNITSDRTVIIDLLTVVI